MPSSRPNTIPIVVHLLQQIKPSSILDVGVGFGKWGHLFREYTDINESERDPKRYHRDQWQVRIDGIEGHATYITEMHRFLYDQIHLGDALEILPDLRSYDLIFMGDIIEHLDKEQGKSLLQTALEKAGKAVILSTPKFETLQADLCDNELERHRSLWAIEDFETIQGAQTTTVDGDTIIAVIRKPGLSPFVMEAPKAQNPDIIQKWQKIRDRLAGLLPLHESFILIDDEQVRSFLPHHNVIPFLERNGQFWGPPDSEDTAVAELERLVKAGAMYLVLVETSYWWRQQYPAFFRHLSESYPCLVDDQLMAVYELRTG